MSYRNNVCMNKNGALLVTLLALLLSTQLACASGIIRKDVCVIGGGPSGLSAAVFAKDRGASVAVFEIQDVWGGNCDTDEFEGAPAGAPNYIELGTAAFQNTALLRTINGDTWSIDSVALANRFAPGRVIMLDLTNPNNSAPQYAASFVAGVSLGALSSTPEQQADFGAALGRLLALHRKYPGLEQSNWSSPTEPELLQPFSATITNYQLESLEIGFFNQLLHGGGFTDYRQATTLYVLAALKPALIYLFTVPNAGFIVAGGCMEMYNGMVDYIGEENVYTSTRVTLAVRPPAGSNLPVLLTTLKGRGSRTRVGAALCDNLIIAFPQKLSEILFLGPDFQEISAFKDFSYRYIYTLEVAVSGPIADSGKGFTLLNFDLTKPGFVPPSPSIAYFQRNLPYGPAQAPLISDTPLTHDQVVAAFRQQTDHLPDELITNVTLVLYDAHDQYQPYVPVSELAKPINVFQKIRNLQGHRKTYWISTSLGTPDTVNSWELAYNTVQTIPL